MDSLILEHADLYWAVAYVLVAGSMVVSGLGIIWCVRQLIFIICDDYGDYGPDIRPEDRFIGWSKEDEAGFQEYLKKSNWK